MAEAKHPLTGIGFIDIETVSDVNPIENRESISIPFMKRFGDRAIREWYVSISEFYERNSPLYAEHGKIVCISIGYWNKEGKFKMKSFAGRHEKELLEAAAPVLEKFYTLAGHNILEFDLPFLFRRYLINGLPVPSPLVVYGKKTWEIPHIDTMKIWSHAAWNYKVSLDMLAHVFGLPSPKENMSGADVGKMYWSMFDGLGDDELPFEIEKTVMGNISRYCEGDVLTSANVYCKMKGIAIITPEQIEHA